jgi:hypothetical protein
MAEGSHLPMFAVMVILIALVSEQAATRFPGSEIDEP